MEKLRVRNQKHRANIRGLGLNVETWPRLRTSALSAELRVTPPPDDRASGAFLEMLPHLLESSNIRLSKTSTLAPGRFEFIGHGAAGELEPALEIFLYRWNKGGWSGLAFEAARRRALESVTARIHSPWARLESNFRADVSAKAVRSTGDLLEALKRLGMSEFWSWWRAQRQRSTLSVYLAGAATQTGTDMAVARAFDERRQAPSSVWMPTLRAPAQSTESGRNRHALRMTFKTGVMTTDQLGALLVINELIGGHEGRLRVDLRGRQQVDLVTDVVSLDSGPALTVTITHPPGMESELREHIRSSLERMAETSTVIEVIHSAIERILNGQAVDSRSPEGKVRLLQWQSALFKGNNPTSLDRNFRTAVQRVTPPDVQSLSKRLFVWSNRMETSSEKRSEAATSKAVSLGGRP